MLPGNFIESEFENGALGVVLRASERAGPEVTHLMLANRPFPPPPRSLAPDTEAFIGSFDEGPNDSMEVGMHVRGDWGEH